jgi:hypothetical protein
VTERHCFSRPDERPLLRQSVRIPDDWVCEWASGEERSERRRAHKFLGLADDESAPALGSCLGLIM